MGDVVNIKKHEDPPLTIEQFYEKTVKLNEVYQHNQQQLFQENMKKQQALFLRMSEADRVTVIEREKAKLQDSVSKLIIENEPGAILDRTGRKITTH